MLDEFTKGADPVKNMLHPMLEKANPRLGDIPLTANTIVFLTGNLTTDGVGDSLKAHSRNRLVPVTIAKPDAEQWIEWAIGKGLEPEVKASQGWSANALGKRSTTRALTPTATDVQISEKAKMLRTA